MHPKTQLRIGNWNVRTLYAQGKAAQAAKTMREAKLQIMGISESRWCGSGEAYCEGRRNWTEMEIYIQT